MNAVRLNSAEIIVASWGREEKSYDAGLRDCIRNLMPNAKQATVIATCPAKTLML
jgi:hypothetical protein